MSNISAFPTYHGGYTKCYSDGGGMTLRDYFAGKAMQVLMADKDFLLRNDPEQVADRAYTMADAMIKAREQA